MNVLIGNRCCSSHLMMKGSRIYEEDLRLITVYSNYSNIEVSEVTKFFETFSVRVDSEIIDTIPECCMDEKRLKVFTGLTWPQFNEILGMITTMRNSSNRDISQALFVFLFKMRSGNSNKLIASILGLKYEQKVSDFCDSVMRAFKCEILPVKFGLHAYSR